MIWVKNTIIPFGSYAAITIWPFVFHKLEKISPRVLNHENIHGKQQKELLIIPFYIIYILEAILKGYKNISFEKEAHGNDENLTYLDTRKWFAMWR